MKEQSFMRDLFHLRQNKDVKFPCLSERNELTMNDEKLRIGVALTGSFCTIDEILEKMEELTRKGYDLTPIISYEVAKTDTRFGKAEDTKRRLKEITGKEIIASVVDAEPIGPKKMFDAIIVAPCTGSTLSRLANGLNDTPVTMAVKSQLRNGKPVILGIATNDGLGTSLKNIAQLKNTRNIYFVPLGQDDYVQKPNSLVADFSLMEESIKAALNGFQLQPFLLKE